MDLVERELGFPVVVKTLKGTRGEGVLLCSNREQFNDLASLLDGAKPGADFIFQQYIAESHGRDVRVLVIDCKAVAAMERRSADGGFKANISLGGVASPFELSQPMADLAVRVADVLGWMSRASTSCSTRTAIAYARPIRRQACKLNVPEEIFRAMERKHGLPDRPQRSLWRRLTRSLGALLGPPQPHSADP